MTYEETLDWLFQKLPMYQKIGTPAFKKSMDNTLLLDAHLQHPHTHYPTIHVGGTNGKGSVSHMMAAVLQTAGYKVGLYTSPHLKDFRERLKVNGQLPPKEFVTDFITQHKPFIEQHDFSFFELTVAMAFQYFFEQGVDIAVIEVGLGGRLDSTNIISPLLSVITNISFDHTHILGNTLEAIAFEKAGIIKDNIPVIIGERHTVTTPIFKNVSQQKNAPLLFAEDEIIQLPLKTDLLGDYQHLNTRTAVVALTVLSDYLPIPKNAIATGLSSVVSCTGLQGRWQILNQDPIMICDTAHNEAGIRWVVNQLQTISAERLHLVLGFVADKDIHSLLDLFPSDAYYYFSQPNIPRKLSIERLESIVDKKNARFFTNLSEALTAAKATANEQDAIFIGGSTFVVTEIL